MYKLYSYFRSSAAFRVRIALNLKNIPYEIIGVHLLQDGGQHRHPDYLEKNPQGLVPLLEDSQGHRYAQSLNIMEFLDEQHLNPRLIPADPQHRSYVREIANIIACDIHPLNNLRVLSYLKNEFHVDDETKAAWYQHWIQEGFEPLERLLNQHNFAKNCCLGNTPTMADACLIPQIYNAIRFHCPMSDYPTLRRIYEHCMTLSSFIKASPESQPDAA